MGYTCEDCHKLATNTQSCDCEAAEVNQTMLDYTHN